MYFKPEFQSVDTRLRIQELKQGAPKYDSPEELYYDVNRFLLQHPAISSDEKVENALRNYERADHARAYVEALNLDAHAVRRVMRLHTMGLMAAGTDDKETKIFQKEVAKTVRELDRAATRDKTEQPATGPHARRPAAEPDVGGMVEAALDRYSRELGSHIPIFVEAVVSRQLALHAGHHRGLESRMPSRHAQSRPLTSAPPSPTQSARSSTASTSRHRETAAALSRDGQREGHGHDGADTGRKPRNSAERKTYMKARRNKQRAVRIARARLAAASGQAHDVESMTEEGAADLRQ